MTYVNSFSAGIATRVWGNLVRTLTGVNGSVMFGGAVFNASLAANTILDLRASGANIQRDVCITTVSSASGTIVLGTYDGATFFSGSTLPVSTTGFFLGGWGDSSIGRGLKNNSGVAAITYCFNWIEWR